MSKPKPQQWNVRDLKGDSTPDDTVIMITPTCAECGSDSLWLIKFGNDWMEQCKQCRHISILTDAEKDERWYYEVKTDDNG